MKKLNKKQRRSRRHKRIRARVSGTAKVPRLCLFKSNQYIYAQLIDDEKGRVIVSAKADLNLVGAKKVGATVTKDALKKKISQIVFDRAGYKYHGRVKALAEAAREAGLKF